MKKRFKQKYYSIEKIVFQPHIHYETDPNGYLFADRTWKTKIKPEDLPPWFVYGRFYKCFGYMTTKGITDMVYIPSRFSNHFLKDDCLMIAYGGKIKELPYDGDHYSRLDRYEGWDERVWGGEILSMIRGARKYSNYDISDLVKQLEDKVVYMRENFPDQFGDFHYDVQEAMNREV